ncbi:T9SS type A sorting domain-containing protein [Paenimyroides baculatum]|uniref:T9SS type A sorting domain-containing protein n=1 Tax=Paenimyroides baculatum TaxID=2608000 RepID=A0A5M6CSK5_9FLAO|nr:T9SS type A sorting domain-containing protein [Paenimyroides baculatum]KAA5538217.1 T9SS type A sorting domain-containing protein [Paenimyroides baculatum]
MKKLLLSTLLLSSLFTAKSQTTVFEDSFETYTNFAIANVGNWTLNDVDKSTTYGFQGVTFANTQLAQAFTVFNSTATTPPLTASATSNWSARTGSKAMICFAATTPSNNDWLISPQIMLGSTGNVLKFWAKSCDTSFGAERFKVGISTTGTAPANFTIITASPYITNPATAQWVEYTFNLDPSYDAKQVYIAINCVSNDQFGFAIDDFKVTTTGTVSNEKFFTENFNLYPNPTSDVLNISSKSGLEMKEIKITDLSGRIVKTLNNATTINVSDLSAGTYLIDITTNEGKVSSKFVKK